MKSHPALIALTAGLFNIAYSPPALGQDDHSADRPAAEISPSSPGARPNLNRSFGPVGLLAEFNSNENFGVLQSRLGAYRTHQAHANAGGPDKGYRDTFDNWVFPGKVTVSIPGSNGSWFVRAGGVAILSRTHGGNLTRTETDTYTGQLQALRLIGNDTLVGAGIFVSDVSVDLLHNGGQVETSGLGAQIDFLHKLNDRFGISGRAIYDGLDIHAEIPIGPDRKVVTERTGERLYLEMSAVYNLPGEQVGFVPDGWRLRPVVTGIYQSISYDAGRNSFGAPIPAFTEEFGALLLTARLESTEARPWKLAPYVTAGSEIQLRNNASQVDSDPGNLYLRAGVAMNTGGKGRLDLYYARRDSFEGTYQANNFSAVLSMLF